MMPSVAQLLSLAIIGSGLGAPPHRVCKELCLSTKWRPCHRHKVTQDTTVEVFVGLSR
jgi:hypothetical protein